MVVFLRRGLSPTFNARVNLPSSVVTRHSSIVCSSSSSDGQRLQGAAHWNFQESWADVLKSQLAQPSFAELVEFIEAERSGSNGGDVLPPAERQLAAFDACPFDHVAVVILGQDPYPTPGHANGLAFSVSRDVRPLPGSLRNIYAELQSDLNVAPASHGCLQSWADQGVLLLNAVLTTRAHTAGAHSGKGWERLTDAAVSALSDRRTGLVFMLWGASAQRKEALIDRSSHLVLRAPHPSPLSARRGFFGCAHFSAANRYMRANGRRVIDWSSHLRDPVAPRAAATKTPVGAAVQPPASPESRAVQQGRQGEGTFTQSRSEEEPPSPVAAATTAVAGAAPHEWWKQLKAIERARSARNAPVDFLGCHTLGEPADGRAAFRFQTLIALILSPRTQDATVAYAMGRLRALACAHDDDDNGSGRMTASSTAAIDLELLTTAVSSVTFARQKAERVLQVAAQLRDEHDGDVPCDLKLVLKLPGVGPKVAHLFMQVGCGQTLGVAVDTHVHRITARLGWTRGAKNAEATRRQLEQWLPREHWQAINPLLVGFGQQVCSDKSPACRTCRLAAERVCPQIGVEAVDV